MTHVSRLYRSCGLLIMLLVSPLSAFAFGFGFILGPFSMLGIVLGSFVGLTIALIFVLNSKNKVSIKTAVLLPAMAAGVVMGAVLGNGLGLAGDFIAVYSSPFMQGMREVENLEKIPLKHAACAADVEQVRKIVATPLNGATRDHLGRIVAKCALYRNGETEQRMEIFQMLMPVLHQQYLKGQVADPDERFSKDYCSVLGIVIMSMNKTHLQRMQALRLPLHCKGGKSRLKLDRFAANIHLSKEQFEEGLSIIELLHSAGTPLAQARGRSNDSLLDEVIDDAHPRLIVALLRAGVDPGHKPGTNKYGTGFDTPAVMVWAKRKFRRCPECPFSHGANLLTQEEIDSVDQLMRPPTAAEINYLRPDGMGGPALRDFEEFKDHADGGAAYFRYLKAHGADVGIVMSGNGKTGFLWGTASIHPALLAELEKLTPQEVDRMAHPTVPGSGEKGKPLLKSVHVSKNTELVKFLCRRMREECFSVTMLQ